jgi:hypothetical protein
MSIILSQNSGTTAEGEENSPVEAQNIIGERVRGPVVEFCHGPFLKRLCFYPIKPFPLDCFGLLLIQSSGLSYNGLNERKEFIVFLPLTPGQQIALGGTMKTLSLIAGLIGPGVLLMPILAAADPCPQPTAVTVRVVTTTFSWGTGRAIAFKDSCNNTVNVQPFDCDNGQLRQCALVFLGRYYNNPVFVQDDIASDGYYALFRVDAPR